MEKRGALARECFFELRMEELNAVVPAERDEEMFQEMKKQLRQQQKMDRAFASGREALEKIAVRRKGLILLKCN